MKRLVLAAFGLSLAFALLASCDDGSDGDGDLDADGAADADGDADADADADAGPDADEDGDGEPGDPRWDSFLAARQGYLAALAPPIVDCVARDDTANGVFHGCYDWHSAAHGLYALLALGRLTGDAQYAALAEAELAPANLARELAALESGSFPEANNPAGYDELPYGYAWFLVLAAERERAGDEDLVAMADLIADGLFEFLSTSPRVDPRDICANYHDNLSWAVLNLWAHASRRGEVARTAWLEAYARDVIVAQDARCPLAGADDERREFFPPALLRAMVIVTVLPEAERDAWLEASLPASFDLEPITREELLAAGAHLAGLNFARSWGLHALYRATGDRVFRDLYLDHIEANMAMPEFWDLTSSYLNSHWIPQFGVHGIGLSYE